MATVIFTDEELKLLARGTCKSAAPSLIDLQKDNLVSALLKGAARDVVLFVDPDSDADMVEVPAVFIDRLRVALKEIGCNDV